MKIIDALRNSFDEYRILVVPDKDNIVDIAMHPTKQIEIYCYGTLFRFKRPSSIYCMHLSFFFIFHILYCLHQIRSFWLWLRIHTQHPHPVTARWYILTMYSLNSFLQSLELLMYQSLPEIVYECYKEANISSAELNLILTFGSFGTLLSIPAMIFVDAYTSNIRILTLFCLVFLNAQNLLRMIPHWINSAMPHALVFMVLSQMFNNFGAAFSYTLPSRVSSAWFPPEERVLTTGIGSLINPFGAALTFLVVPLVVRDANDFVTVLYIMLILQGIVSIVIIIYFPAKPPVPPSHSELAKEVALEEEAKEILKQLNGGVLPESIQTSSSPPFSSSPNTSTTTSSPPPSYIPLVPAKIRAKRALEPVMMMVRVFKHRQNLILVPALNGGLIQPAVLPIISPLPK